MRNIQNYYEFSVILLLLSQCFQPYKYGVMLSNVVSGAIVGRNKANYIHNKDWLSLLLSYIVKEQFSVWVVILS
jgi:hypothetical protein